MWCYREGNIELKQDYEMHHDHWIELLLVLSPFCPYVLSSE